MKHPSAWLPVAMSLTVLAMWIIGIAAFGVPAREADEGTGAHLFQIWLVLEVLMVAFFTLKWLPQRSKQALVILALQIAVVFAACTPVFFFHL